MTIPIIKREVPVISLKDYENRQDEIRNQLIYAAENVGFFSVVDHGLSITQIEEQFARSKAFFDLDKEIKALTPHVFKSNTGWEYRSQIRPSTGTADEKESLWLQYRSKDTQWPEKNLKPTWKEETVKFIKACHDIAMKILRLFAIELGFEEDHFEQAHQIQSPESLDSLRLLHYYPTEDAKEGYWRAGTHTDIGVLTLLFQRENEDGLEICPGREASNSFASGDQWSAVPAHSGPIVCNIGDMLSKQPSRYSIAYFNQAMESSIVQGPLKRYPATTAKEYIAATMKRNFAALAAASQ